MASYLAGRFPQAAQQARAAAQRARREDRASLETLATNIESFGRLYGRIQAARFGASARHDMEQAIALDRRISRNPQYRSRLQTALVEIYLSDAQRQRASPVASCTSVRQALAIDRGNSRAQQLSAQCESQARGMMREAASASPDRAQALYRTVLLMVPSGSPVAAEANGRLQSARRRTTVDEDE